MKLLIDPNTIEGYQTFLKVKSLPAYTLIGREAIIPDEYKNLFSSKPVRSRGSKYHPLPCMFDYQKAIAERAIAKRRFAAFLSPGMGKTLIMFEFARYALEQIAKSKRVLIVSPLMVIRQSLSEANRFYGDDLVIEQLRAKQLADWLSAGKVSNRIAITNYEAIVDGLDASNIGALILDESSLLKSHYGKWGQRLISMGRGVEWKLCLTGTPAPNDRIEYANHAVFLDQYPTVNAFLARFFVNRGQTDNRWELKPHALKPFYRALSHWSIFLNDPSVYGWKDNVGTLPPINVHIEDVELTREQNEAASAESKALFAVAGGITSRAKLAQIAKGNHNGKKIGSNKPEHILGLLNSFTKSSGIGKDGSPASSIIWCRFNREQDDLAGMLPDAANISGDTPEDTRADLIDEFKSGDRSTLISKPKLLGFGLNLQICSKMIFSSLQDSYEEYYQAVKRANRYGSTSPLDVYIPVTEIERPMIETVLRKARMVEEDTREQERIFKESICA